MDQPTASDPPRRQPTSVARSRSRRAFLGTLGVVGLGALAGCTGTLTSDSEYDAGGAEARLRESAATFLTQGTLYKAPNCNCCLEYAAYLEENTDATIDTVEVDDLAETKTEYGVPEDVESCHTVDVGEYFVEGHVPLEAIGKLADEQPAIAGIALPEMPSGSPGMPGAKTEEFVIYAVHDDGSYDEFMTL